MSMFPEAAASAVLRGLSLQESQPTSTQGGQLPTQFRGSPSRQKQGLIALAGNTQSKPDTQLETVDAAKSFKSKRLRLKSRITDDHSSNLSGGRGCSTHLVIAGVVQTMTTHVGSCKDISCFHEHILSA